MEISPKKDVSKWERWQNAPQRCWTKFKSDHRTFQVFLLWNFHLPRTVEERDDIWQQESIWIKRRNPHSLIQGVETAFLRLKHSVFQPLQWLSCVISQFGQLKRENNVYSWPENQSVHFKHHRLIYNCDSAVRGALKHQFNGLNEWFRAGA